MSRPVYIHAIRTAVPGFRASQRKIFEFMAARPEQTADSRAFLRKIYEHSAIDTRYSVLPDFAQPSAEAALQSPGERAGTGFFDGSSPASTRDRNSRFVEAARAGGIAVTRSLFAAGMPAQGSVLAGLHFRRIGDPPDFEYNHLTPPFLAGPGTGNLAPDLTPDKITHLITVSCTGFSAPGFDIDIQEALGLSRDLQKSHIGFMGCYATFPALRLADAICKSDPRARVLIVSVEFCTLHFQSSTSRDLSIANSLFADGLGAMLVSAVKSDSARIGRGRPPFRIDAMASRFLGGGEKTMAWTVGNTGFEMKLSAYVPKLIEENIGQIVDDICSFSGVPRRSISNWAIHPGGRAILDRFCERMNIPKTDLSDSYKVLLDYGNMSSASICFVLAGLANRMDAHTAAGGLRAGSGAHGSGVARQGTAARDKQLRAAHRHPQQVFAASFGPGLTVEASLLSLLPARQRVRFGVVSVDLPALLPRTRFRAVASELMDSPAVNSEALRRTYQQFSRINRNLSSYRRILKREIFAKLGASAKVGASASVAVPHSGTANAKAPTIRSAGDDCCFTVLDLGCGSGDILVWMAKQARKLGIPMRFVGADPDPQALEVARSLGRGFPEIEWIDLDSSGIEAYVAKHGRFDWIISNHVLHHLSEADAEEFLRKANAAAKRGIVINDIRRSALGYLGYRVYAALFARRSLARYDGSLSVLRSLNLRELERIAQSAGRGDLLVRTAAPFRLIVTRK